jgi:hypothetical protein
MRINKAKATILLISILAVTPIMASIMQSANAFETSWDTFAYAIVAPDPVGIEQSVLITAGIDKVNPLTSGVARGEFWEGTTVKITKPDGTTETKGPYQLYAMANTFISYTPTQTGTYTVETIFPGQWVNASYRSISSRFGSYSNFSSGPLLYEARWYKPDSASTTFTVQEEPIPSYPAIPIPTDVWTRPLNAEIKDWDTVADNWLMPTYQSSGNYANWRFSATADAPYTSAPNSPHILWKQPVTFGGVLGGGFGDVTYRNGLSYEPWYSDALIINGRIYYTVKGTSTASVFGTRVLNLYTGEEIMYVDGVDIDFAQTLDFNSPNEHGALAYLWDSTGGGFDIYDAFEFKQVARINDMSSGSVRFGPNGEVLVYRIAGSQANRRLSLWNSTLALGRDLRAGIMEYYGENLGSWVVDGKKGIQWNVSVPALPGNPGMSIINDEVIILTDVDMTQFPTVYIDAALPATLKKTAGNYPTQINYLWQHNRTNIYTHRPSLGGLISAGCYSRWDESTRQHHIYDIYTGVEKFATDPLPMGWAMFTSGTIMVEGKLVSGDFGGHLRAWDLTDGSLIWEYYMGDAPYLENAYGTWPAYGFTIADGKIFVSNDEHSPDSVQWRGAKLTAIDLETGEFLWSVGGRHKQSIISDGILTGMNIYDMQIYTFGKGPSKTTVSVPGTAVEVGQSITITGSVTDQTPSSKDTPAISDEDMGDWMEYLHMQHPIPANAKGVEVLIDTIDPNGNYIHIGETTSDMMGSFGFTWIPEVPGLYQIIASFAGSDSYGSSSASTYFTAIGASVATPPPEPTPAPMTDTYLAGSTIAILAGIAIAVFLLLRKK